MPFDPAFPATDALLVSAEFRAQFNALNDKIDAQAAQIAAQQTALAATAHKPDLGALSLALDDPPTSAQVQAVINQLNTLLTLLTV